MPAKGFAASQLDAPDAFGDSASDERSEILASRPASSWTVRSELGSFKSRCHGKAAASRRWSTAWDRRSAPTRRTIARGAVLLIRSGGLPRDGHEVSRDSIGPRGVLDPTRDRREPDRCGGPRSRRAVAGLDPGLDPVSGLSSSSAHTVAPIMLCRARPTAPAGARRGGSGGDLGEHAHWWRSLRGQRGRFPHGLYFGRVAPSHIRIAGRGSILPTSEGVPATP
jgi:hypothetical protein